MTFNINNINFFFLFFILSALTSCHSPEHQEEPGNMVLWYTEPARIWEEALPIGNGRLGAMIYGGTGHETIQLNEETVWAGEPGNNILPEIKEHLPEIRQLIFEGKHQEAQERANHFLPRRPTDNNNYGMCYQPVGHLHISTPDSIGVSGYKRSLDISKALATVTYNAGGVQYKREILSSLNDDILAIQITADQPSSISCRLSIDSPHPSGNTSVENNVLHMTGQGSDMDNKKGRVVFSAMLKARLTNGELTHTDSSLVINKADTLTIYLSIATNFRAYNDLSAQANEQCRHLLDQAFEKPFRSVKEDHIARYSHYFDRVSIFLGSSDSIRNPTDQRLSHFTPETDPQLIALYYQFGRYLLISSSQPGTQAANLQGLWNNRMFPPWDSKYTVNINTEMNYWPAEATQLSEMHQPLFDLIRDISLTGQEAARNMYGARGWNIHHNTDIWRISGVVDGAFYGLWPMGGAWLSQHLWYHYLYTGDEDFLREYYPVLKGASLFFKDILVEEPEHGWLVVAPSMSPENAHHPKTSIAAGTTMDNQLIRDVFENIIEASAILGIDQAYSDSIAQLLPRLAPMQTGHWGQLQEWLNDWDDPGNKHRHVSHLYGLYPSNQISPYHTPQLFDAARTSLLARGDESTGWSMGWKVNLWARLLDGNHAMKLISDQLKPSIQPDGEHKGGTYPNLFDAHPPFQIDGNFGCTAGITEMLLQSHDGAIHLLPALPDSWDNGHINGIMARGGFRLNLSWNDGQLEQVSITSTLGGACRIRSYVPLEGPHLMEARGGNTNPLFKTRARPDWLYKDNKDTQPVGLKVIYEYDLSTQKGEQIRFKRGSE